MIGATRGCKELPVSLSFDHDSSVQIEWHAITLSKLGTLQSVIGQWNEHYPLLSPHMCRVRSLHTTSFFLTAVCVWIWSWNDDAFAAKLPYLTLIEPQGTCFNLIGLCCHDKEGSLWSVFHTHHSTCMILKLSAHTYTLDLPDIVVSVKHNLTTSQLFNSHSLSLSPTHTHIHVHTVCVCVCVYAHACVYACMCALLLSNHIAYVPVAMLLTGGKTAYGLPSIANAYMLVEGLEAYSSDWLSHHF